MALIIHQSIRIVQQPTPINDGGVATRILPPPPGIRYPGPCALSEPEQGKAEGEGGRGGGGGGLNKAN